MAGINASATGIASNSQSGSGLGTAMFQPQQQPASTPRGGQIPYYIPPNQYTPFPAKDPTNPANDATNMKAIYKSLIPTSVNVRNLGLQQVLQQLGTPEQSLYLSQGMDSAAQNYGQTGGQLASLLASRGLTGSGPANAANETNSAGYLQNVAGAQFGAQQQGDSRTNNLLNQLMGISQSDTNFYQAIRSGSLPAGAAAGPPNYGFPQLAQGLATLVKTIASYGAGAAAGGGGAGGTGGMGADYGTTAGAAGDYGMSSAGSAISGAGDYGISYGGLNGGISNAGGGGGWQGALQGYASGGLGGGLAGYYGGGY